MNRQHRNRPDDRTPEQAWRAKELVAAMKRARAEGGDRKVLAESKAGEFLASVADSLAHWTRRR